jgi:hypothetical protein
MSFLQEELHPNLSKKDYIVLTNPSAAASTVRFIIGKVINIDRDHKSVTIFRWSPVKNEYMAVVEAYHFKFIQDYDSSLEKLMSRTLNGK